MESSTKKEIGKTLLTIATAVLTCAGKILIESVADRKK